MNVEEIVEALMCTAGSQDILSGIAPYGSPLWWSAHREMELVHHSTWDTTYTYDDICLEAAYRLIESSPRLRREWFGR